MLNYLKQEIYKYNSLEEKFNHLREILQIQALKFIDKLNYSSNIAFVGGTALRILYKVKRFSEDLDFSLINKENFSFEKMTNDLIREFSLLNIDLNINTKTKKNVYIAQLKFSKLLYELNLSNIKEQKLYIKLELDTNPPQGANLEYSIQKEFFGIKHYAIESLYAGKLHALLYRKYTKGRDFYDFMWYLTNNINVNLELLNNAISQSTARKSKLDKKKLKEKLIEMISKTDFKKVNEDLETFIFDKNELKLITKENFLNLLKQNRHLL